jgi:hypothetical protein
MVSLVPFHVHVGFLTIRSQSLILSSSPFFSLTHPLFRRLILSWRYGTGPYSTAQTAQHQPIPSVSPTSGVPNPLNYFV